MAESMNYTCRIDPVVRKKSESLYASLGMNLSTAINVFLRESIRSGGFPFDVRLKFEQAVSAPVQETTVPAVAVVTEDQKDSKKKKKAKK